MSQADTGVVILISGRGSNMRAIVEEAQRGRLPVTVRAVISNRADAPGLRDAREAGVATDVIDHRAYASRAAFDAALRQAIDRYRPDLVILAGFMRILGDEFVRHYAGRLMNIHPSLLPRFTGLDTHARALAEGATVHGASVHFVTPELDGGPVIIQAPVPVLPDDTPDRLAARVLKEEHRIYPLAVRWFAQGRLSIDGGRVLLDGARRPEQGFTEAGRAPGGPATL